MKYNFYPGPSKLYPAVANWLADAAASELLARNHRSRPFMDMLAQTLADMKSKLAIPPDYRVIFASSATECWEIVNQSFLLGQTYMAYNGAFGEKWFEYAKKNPAAFTNAKIEGIAFDLNAHLPTLPHTPETICLTHNETSNGTFLPDSDLELLRRTHPEAVIALDATSSMAGVALPWHLADIWFASVQKCFGLPAGLAVMVVSPHAYERAEQIADNSYYNSYLTIQANFDKFQTPYTPNMVGIYLLHRWAQSVEPIANVHETTRSRQAVIEGVISHHPNLELLVKTPERRSPTVVSVSPETGSVSHWHTAAAKAGILLGNGYGPWKDTSFRIANFPAVLIHEIEILQNWLKVQLNF